MITHEWANQFARDWIDAWNAHDLDRVLAHYTADFEMSSPYTAKFAGEPSGTLRGRERVRAYWQNALTQFPDLHFELTGVFTGADSIAIHYRGVQGKQVVEVLFFDATKKAYKALAHYDRE